MRMALEAAEAKIERLSAEPCPHPSGSVVDGVCRRNFPLVYSSPWFEDLPLINLRSLISILIEIKERTLQSATINPGALASATPV